MPWHDWNNSYSNGSALTKHCHLRLITRVVKSSWCGKSPLCAQTACPTAGGSRAGQAVLLLWRKGVDVMGLFWKTSQKVLIIRKWTEIVAGQKK
jgi:hypothetical protein